jgi:anion-transporting  ArsA/GET3 family ATPase
MISLDRAHSLDALLRRIEDLSGSAHLDVVEPDFDELAREWLASISREIRRRYRYLVALNLDKLAELIRLSPGVSEHVLCRAFHDLVLSRDGREITLVDMPATASLHGFVNYALASGKWLDVLEGLERRVVAGNGYLSRVTGRAQRRGDAPDGEEDGELGRRLSDLKKLFHEVASALSAERTRFVGVFNPDELSLEELAQSAEALERAKASYDLVVANRYRAPNGGSEDQAAGASAGASSHIREMADEARAKLGEVSIAFVEHQEMLDRSSAARYLEIGELLWKRLALC